MRIGISTLFLAGVTAGMASMESSSSKVASSSRLHERSYVKPLSCGGGNATATPSMQMQMNTFVTSTMVPGKSGCNASTNGENQVNPG
ncbi:hypothetical protein PENSUB_13038 [Penicillium subrubescens]|uniref:Uncharacterized protein n=1 Tax=Penicillium subrubescens TaxID=1316194 RepID=A0A1Q5SUE1_9EURO|nr:hypothetical protein PENSUB_13038 [Penicillium subrubescens]